MRDMALLKKGFSEWNGRVGATWSTHLSDLRHGAAPAGSLKDPAAAVALDLKVLALLHERVYIRDSDLVNCPGFWELFLRDSDGVRQAIERGVLVLGLRTDAASFSDLNGRQGSQRANPQFAAEAVPFCTAIDDFASTKGIVTVGGNVAEASTLFEEHLRARSHGPDKVLDQRELELVEHASVTAMGRRDDGRLYFGHLYPLLLQAGEDPGGKLIQLLRAIHMLAPAHYYGVSPSLADSDIHPTLAAAALGMQPQVLGAAAPEWLELLPQGVPDARAFASLSWKKIIEHRSSASGGDYFLALRELQAVAATDRSQNLIAAKFIPFAEALNTYLKQLASLAAVELRPWQAALIREHLSAADEWARMGYAIPFAVASVAGTFAAVLTMNPLGGAAIVGLGHAIGTGAGKVLDRAAAGRRAKFETLLSGHTLYSRV